MSDFRTMAAVKSQCRYCKRIIRKSNMDRHVKAQHEDLQGLPTTRPVVTVAQLRRIELGLRTRVDLLAGDRDRARAESIRLRRRLTQVMAGRTDARNRAKLWRHRALIQQKGKA